MAKQTRRFESGGYLNGKEGIGSPDRESHSGDGSGPVKSAARVQVHLPRAASFWSLAALLGLLLFAASAPSPLYGVYEARYHFTPLTLTSIYAMYSLAALIASLTTGRLSDHLGRRPVLMLALIVQIAGMAAFIVARGVPALFAGRFLQGLGTGIATGTISAWLLDLQPTTNPRLGGLVGGIALLAGLGAGALVAGALVQYGPDPLQLIFWLLIGIYTLAFIGMFTIPDVVRRSPGWLRSMRPELGVPSAARSLFSASIPSLVAIWALGGLYLSLGPSLALTLLKTTSHLDGGLVITCLTGAGAIMGAFFAYAQPRRLILWGLPVLIVGVGITLLAVVFSSPYWLYAGSLIAGLGFGPAFLGIFRSLALIAPPAKRSALMTAIYLVVYLSFGIPAIAAGFAAVTFGLRDTTYVYGLVVMALALVTTLMVARSRSNA